MQNDTDYLYYLKWDFSNIFKNYNGDVGYLIFTPWPGGFNNKRMSLELAAAIAFLTNRKLVLPPSEEKGCISDYFELDDTGIKILTFKQFCTIKKIDENLRSVKKISGIANFNSILNILNFEKVVPPKDFLKSRSYINSKDIFTNEECLLFERNLLGAPEQMIYTSLDTEIKKLIAKHIRYKKEIFNIAWDFIKILKDRSYYSLHVRRGDHPVQYRYLSVSAEVILENIKDIIPLGAKLYISTDHQDKDFFKILKEKYEVYFYEDLTNSLGEKYKNINLNLIAIIEQLICSRGIKFVGNKISTLSTLIYRIRGYMQDIEDKNYYVNTEKFKKSEQVNFLEDKEFVGSWVRYYKDSWDLNKKKIFVSIASFCDTDVINTIKSLKEEAFDSDRVHIGLHLQDSEDSYKKILSYNFKNLKIKFTTKELTKGVNWARNKIKEELYENEDYFLQLDSHSRVKKNWDNILINQYKSFGLDKVVLSTYPNHFDIPDEGKKYLLVPNNAPIRLVSFINDDENDNRFRVKNTNSLKDYEMVHAYWISGGFFFTTKKWVKEVKYPDDINFKGEEDVMTILSYRQGWNLRLTSEATVWHNYNYKIKDEGDLAGAENPTTGKIYREQNFKYKIEDKSIDIVNNCLFNNDFEKTTEDFENYFGIDLRNKKIEIYKTELKKEIDEQIPLKNHELPKIRKF